MLPSSCSILLRGTSSLGFFSSTGSSTLFSSSACLFFLLFTKIPSLILSCYSVVMFKSILSSSLYSLSHTRHFLSLLISLVALTENTCPHVHNPMNLLRPLLAKLVMGHTITFSPLSQPMVASIFLMSPLLRMYKYLEGKVFETRPLRRLSQLQTKPRRHMARRGEKGYLVRLHSLDLATATALGSARSTFFLSLTSSFLRGMSPPSFPMEQSIINCE